KLIPTGGNGEYQIESALREGLVLEVSGRKAATYPLIQVGQAGKEAKQRWKLVRAQDTYPYSVSLSPDNRYFSACANFHDGGTAGVWVWHLETGKLYRELPAETCGIPRFTPDGKHVVAFANHPEAGGLLTLYDLEKDKMVHRFGPKLPYCWAGMGHVAD